LANRQYIGSDFSIAKDAAATSAHIRCRNEQLHGGLLEAIEIDAFCENGAEGVEAERI